jgi:Putative Ig domain
MRSASLTIFLAAICAACGGGGGGGSPPAPAAPPPPPPPPPAPNVSPVVSSPIPDARAVNKHFFSYDVTQGGTTFSDGNGDRLTYQIQMTGSWDGLAASNGTISGTLNRTSVGPADEHIDVVVRASDGRGGTADTSFRINVFENSPPFVARPNLALVTTAGATVNRDLTQGGTTFTDIDGDRLTYEVALIAPSSQINVVGLSAVGALGGRGRRRPEDHSSRRLRRKRN